QPDRRHIPGWKRRRAHCVSRKRDEMPRHPERGGWRPCRLFPRTHGFIEGICSLLHLHVPGFNGLALPGNGLRRPESGVSWPDVGEIDYVFGTAGTCANVRATPGLSGKVVGCLTAGTTVNVDGGPTTCWSNSRV